MAYSLKPSFSELVVSERNELIAKAKKESQADSRVQWISEAKMVPQLALQLQGNKTFMQELTQELGKHGVSMAFLAPSLQALQRGSMAAQSIVLNVGKLVNQFLNNAANAAIQQTPNSSQNNISLNPEALSLTPRFITYITELAEVLQQQNRLVQQNINDFDFNENEEQEIENDQKFNSENKNSPLNNQPEGPSSSADNSEEKHSAHHGLSIVKHAAELEIIAKLAPKLIKGIEEEAVKEFSKIVPTFTKALH